MLKSLRTKTSGFVAKLILGLVVVAFVATGFAGFFRGTPATTVVSAGRTEIGPQDYLLAWRQAEVSIAQRLGRRPTREDARANGIEAQVLSQLVSQAVLDEQGRRLDLGVSQDRLARLIADDPSFHDAAGNFSRGNFRELLASVGMTENEFIRNREQAAVRSQIVDAVARDIGVPQTMKLAFGLHSDERRTVDYLTLPVSLVEPVAEPAPDALATYFESNKARYRAPEYRSVSFAVLTPEAISNPGAVSDEAVAADYERAKARYTVPERRQVQQLLFPDQAAADAAKAKLDGGTSFEALVAERGRTLADVDLGSRAKADLPDRALADAAFALPANGVSGVVAGAFGPAILRVTEIVPESVRPLAEVRDEIRSELALQTAATEIAAAQDALEDARAGGATLAEAAQRAGVPVKTIPAVSRAGDAPDGNRVADLPDAEGFLDAVFTAETGAENPPLPVQPAGSIAYEVTKIDPERERPLDEVRARVIADWKADEAQRLLAARADTLKSRLDKGETLDALAASESLAKDSAPSVTRESAVGQLGRDGAQAAFAGPEGLTTVSRGPDGTSRLVMKVVGVAPPLDGAAAVNATEVRQLGQLAENDFLQSYVDRLRQAYEARSYPQAISQAEASIR